MSVATGLTHKENEPICKKKNRKVLHTRIKKAASNDSKKNVSYGGTD